MKRPMSRRKALIETLVLAYDAGSISLSTVCPSCFQYMDRLDHGKCSKCGKSCGCSFNPTSSGDHCNLHGQMGEYQRNK